MQDPEARQGDGLRALRGETPFFACPAQCLQRTRANAAEKMDTVRPLLLQASELKKSVISPSHTLEV